MRNSRPLSLLHRAVRGYQRILIFSTGILSVMAAAALVSLAIVFPLWLTAIRYPRLYTMVVLGVSAFAILLVIARAILRNGIGPVLTVVRRTVTVVATVMVGYFILVLLANGQLLTGVPLALVFILMLGIVAGWSRVGHKKEESRSNEAFR